MKVVYLPMSLGTTWSFFTSLFFIIVMLVMLSVILVMNVIWVGMMSVVTVGMVVVILAGLVTVVLLVRSRIRYRRTRKMQRENTASCDSPVGEVVRKYPFSDHKIIANLREYWQQEDTGNVSTPLLICLGLLAKKPQPEACLSEPHCYVVRTESFRVFFMAVIGVAVCLTALHWGPNASHIYTFYAKHFLQGLLGLLALGALLYPVFGGKVILRVSPGIVEVFRYPMFGTTPHVTQYPCTAGTTMIMRCVERPDQEQRLGVSDLFGSSLTLSRDDKIETISLYGINIQELSALITSTQVTPTSILSSDALVG